MPNTPVLNLPYPTAADTADVPRDMQALALAVDGQPSILPVGAVILWALALPPAGNLPNGKAAWVICNGQLVSAADYPKLAALLGQAGGNVTIPDLRDRVPLGASATHPIGTPGGEATHLITLNELPVHQHAAGTLTDPATNTGNDNQDHTHSLSPGEFVPAHANGFVISTVAAGGAVAVVTPQGLTGLVNALSTSGRSTAHTHTTAAHAITGSTGNVGAGTPMPLVPLHLSLNYVMRAA